MANTADDGLERLEHEALATGRGAHCLRAQPGVHICMKRMDSQVAPLSCVRTCMAPVRRAREEHRSTMNGTAQMERVCGCPNHKHIISAAARARMCCVSLCETRLTRLTRHACGRGCNSSAAGQRALSGSRVHAVPCTESKLLRKILFFVLPPRPRSARETRRRGLSAWGGASASRPPSAKPPVLPPSVDGKNAHFASETSLACTPRGSRVHCRLTASLSPLPLCAGSVLPTIVSGRPVSGPRVAAF